MATLKPTTPLLAPYTAPLKPASPLRPKTAPKTPISHPQRRSRFHSHTDTSEQRRSRFHSTGPPDRQGLAGLRADAPSHRPARQKTPILGCFERTGRTFSRTRRDNMATLKPTAPLLAPNKGPLKPVAPLRPKTAPKTPISHPQRRWRFHSHTDTSEQRRSRFQTTGTPDRQGLAGRRADAPATRQHAMPHWSGGCRRAWRPGCGARGRWRGLAEQHTATSRAGVEGAGGTGGPGCGARGRWRGLAGLRDDAPSEARGVDGSRAGRRPRAHRAARPTGQHTRRQEHQRGHKQPGTPAGPQAKPGTQTHTQQRARSAAAPRAPHSCQLLTG